MNNEIKIRRQFIEDCVKRYIKNNPADYKIICDSVKRERRKKKNKFGTVGDDDSGVMRWSLRLPEILFNMIDLTLANPRFLEADTEINWFKKKFKQFRVCEKI